MGRYTNIYKFVQIFSFPVPRSACGAYLKFENYPKKLHNPATRVVRAGPTWPLDTGQAAHRTRQRMWPSLVQLVYATFVWRYMYTYFMNHRYTYTTVYYSLLCSYTNVCILIRPDVFVHTYTCLKCMKESKSNITILKK